MMLIYIYEDHIPFVILQQKCIQNDYLIIIIKGMLIFEQDTQHLKI